MNHANGATNNSSSSRSERTNYKLQLILFSALALLMELMLIRYLGTEVLVFSYFKNLTLMSAFLGLSLGLLSSSSTRDFFKWSGLTFLFLNGILLMALPLGLTFMTFVDPFQFMMFFAGEGYGKGLAFPLLITARTLLIMSGIFLLSTFSFVGPGQQIGRLFLKLRPLEAYSINVGGSLIGSTLFTLLAYLQTPPGIWIATAGVLYTFCQRRASHFALIVFGLISALWLGPYVASRVYGSDYVKTLWSPYFRIDLVEAHAGPKDQNTRLGWHVKVSYDTFQELLDCSPSNLSTLSPGTRAELLNFNATPYETLGFAPQKVLILGAGNGSDAQASLRHGSQQVDVVEIDPAICELGRNFHPEKPYNNPKVRVFNMDARTYLKNSHEKYDLIIFSYLDSHTAFSCMSSLRTDNYIFTKESYHEAAKLLKPNGLIYVSFICFKDWLWDRHSKALGQATGMTPSGYSDFNGVVMVGHLMAGPGLQGAHPIQLHWPHQPRSVNMNNSVQLSSDDWPFLFLPSKSFSATYALPLFLILGISCLLLFPHLLSGGARLFNLEMLMLGAGFMLLEVRAIADLSLLFGSTWIVNSFVISGVMLCILLGNWFASKLQSSWINYLLLGMIATLSLSTLIHVADLTQYGDFLGKVLGICIYVLPITIASTVFALFFKNVSDTSSALSFNLFGGLIGVSLEYLSMWLGIRALGMVAIGIYAIILGCNLLANTQSSLKAQAPES
jgi:hypothetical protein